jgi:hypothetical protein
MVQQQALRDRQTLRQLVADVSAPRSTVSVNNQPLLTALAKSATSNNPIKRVFCQYVGPEQRELYKKVQALLQADGYLVPAPERVGSKAPSRTEVRYFNHVDRAQAVQVAKLLASAVSGPVLVQNIANPGDVVPIGQLEIWFAADATPK